MNTRGQRFRQRLSAAMMVLVTFALILQTAVFADGEYLKTWNDYKASGAPATTWNDVANAMDKVLESAKSTFAAGDPETAAKTISDAYYGYYETTGFERMAMGYISGSRKSQMELQFQACRAVSKRGGTAEEFNAEVEKLSAMLHEDANVLDGTSGDSSSSESSSQSEGTASRSAATATFIACFSIILREGFEAILIVGAIIAYLNKAAGDDEKKRKRTIRPVYIGSLLGIGMSFVLAWLLNALKLANSASQEIIEGVTALIAVVVLYYVSNWMLSKSETDAWTKYIKDKVERGREKNSTMALALTAFLAVFREGAEVVLFFQPMLAADNKENFGSVWAGLIIGGIVLVVVYLAIHFLSLTIPIKPFFVATSLLMFFMSISFLGAGIKELIEGEVIGMTSPKWLSFIPSNDMMEVLGIYPILETLIPQLILLVITIIIFVVQTKKNRKIHAEAEERRAKERAKQEAEEKRARDEELRRVIREVVGEMLTERGISGKQS